MTTPLIEAIARAMEKAHVDHVEAHNAALAKAGLWPDHRATPTKAALAQAALTAITEAGMVIVPREPSEHAMDCGAYRLPGVMQEAKQAKARDVYRAMIEAHLDTKEGE